MSGVSPTPSSTPYEYHSKETTAVTIPNSNPLHHPRYPRSNSYDPQWVLDNQMGPNALWLIEALTDVMQIAEGMRVLDLGCGTAMTSIFLAKEFGAQVWATDLWIEASANQRRICAAGVESLVVPIHAEAHALPFAGGFFDVIVSVDAYHYFGTDDLYLGYIEHFLKEKGQIAVVAPALFREIGSKIPEELAPYWAWDFCSFHCPEWWREHWGKTGKVHVDRADAIEEGWKDWLMFGEAKLPQTDERWNKAAADEVAMLQVDQGKNFGFSRLVATKV
jgi:SAM-dependent methyltransferase